ncbi:MAG: SEL1-like repeat protein [Candidatus Methanomethylophilaceae archaeon]|nr:SEL1-like repeat protein [Candidatus Methanomethylophilaceae archaeon]
MARERRVEGSPMALAVLGMAHKDGSGVKKNPARAKQLLWHASRKGVDWAKKELRSIEE